MSKPKPEIEPTTRSLSEAAAPEAYEEEANDATLAAQGDITQGDLTEPAPPALAQWHAVILRGTLLALFSGRPAARRYVHKLAQGARIVPMTTTHPTQPTE